MGITTGGGQLDMKLEVVVIPVSDAERAQKFYSSLGWRQDVTPPGSGVYQFTPNWSDWYAEYMAAEQSGARLPL